jgi:hypothetical protein
MKKRIFLGLLTILCACKHEDEKVLPKDYGCVNVVDIKVNSHLISSTALTEAQTLLSANQIPFDNLRFLSFDTIPPSQNKYRIDAMPYTNGLPVLQEYIAFFFTNDSLWWTEGKIYPSISHSVDIVKHLDLPTIRALFVDATKKDLYVTQNWFNIDTLCIDAQFGYLDLNANQENVAPNFKKAWYVTPHGFNYPEAMFLDNDGTMRSYFNGILTSN